MKYVVVTVLALVLAAAPARGLAIEPSALTDVSELTSGDTRLDGDTVQVEGEVISELLAGGEGHVWANVLSGTTAIGIWMPEEMGSDIEVFGNWKHTGDIIAVTGVFNAACDRHGGDLDIHATDVTLLTRGSERQHPVSYWKLGVSAAAALAAYGGYRRMRRVEEERGDA